MKPTLVLSIALALVAGSLAPAFADDQAKIDATLGRLGRSCKNQVADKFSGVSMADIQVTVAASLKESLDSGAMGLKDLQKYGASFNWEVPSQRAAGSCEVNAKGKVTQFVGK